MRFTAVEITKSSLGFVYSQEINLIFGFDGRTASRARSFLDGQVAILEACPENATLYQVVRLHKNVMSFFRENEKVYYLLVPSIDYLSLRFHHKAIIEAGLLEALLSKGINIFHQDFNSWDHLPAEAES